MFNTIKSKITLISITMLLALSVVLTGFTYIYYKNSKTALIWSYYYKVKHFVQNINNEIISIEDNTKDMALIGNFYYEFGKDKIITENSVAKLFSNYPNSLGGGIWYEPYLINPNKRLSCIYAFRNNDNQVVIDEAFESEEYDYLNQIWYKSIMPKVESGKIVAWSVPYYENQGSNTLMVTAGSGIYDNNKNLIGISTVDWEVTSIVKAVSEIKPTKNSFVLIADIDNNFILVSTDKYLDNSNLIGKTLDNIPWYKDNLKNVTYFTYHHTKYIPYFNTLDNGMVIIVNVPKWELFKGVVISVLGLFIAFTLICLIIVYLLYRMLDNNIQNPIDKLMTLARKISNGETGTTIVVEKPEEFAELAKTIDTMAEDIKLKTKESTRINSELSIAKRIQESSLPNTLNPFPNRKEFDIFASMNPAKEVGGDFYDFYFIDNNKFMFLVADVSGKGVPAALFMMTVKTMINNLSQLNYSPKELIEIINKKICKNNDQGFFVTMLAGIINTETGEISYINCGHNPPLIKTKNGKYEYLKMDSNIVLGAFADAQFNIYNTKLNSGDILFTYTDGITEATNKNQEMYGESRLQNSLNCCNEDSPIEISKYVKNDISKFTEDIAQSDDLTMLIFKFNDKSLSYEYKIEATHENYKSYYNWLNDCCQKMDLSEILTNKIGMCAEEIFANIMFYAYPDKRGFLETTIISNEDAVILEFSDTGLPYNPLEKSDPDITLPPEERPLGGLGIFMVKAMAKNITYLRQDEHNILTVEITK